MQKTSNGAFRLMGGHVESNRESFAKKETTVEARSRGERLFASRASGERERRGGFKSSASSVPVGRWVEMGMGSIGN